MNLLTILLSIFLGIIVLGIIILFYKLGQLSTKENPNEAYVFINKGLHVGKPTKAKIHNNAGTGESFKYKDKVVMIPETYEKRYYCSKRMIFVHHLGQLIASPFDNDVPITETKAENLIYDVCASHVGSDGMRALKGKPTFNLVMIVIIVVAIVAIGIFGYNYFQKQSIAQTQPKIEQPANNQLNQPVEIK